MMNDIKITYYTGWMHFDLDAFFPCSLAKFKKLLKVVEMDYEHRNALTEKLKNYFQERIPNLPLEAEAKQKEAAEHRKKAKEAKALLTAEKKRIRNGGKPPYKEWQYDSQYENAKCAAQEAEKAAKNLLKSKDKFKAYIEILEERGK